MSRRRYVVRRSLVAVAALAIVVGAAWGGVALLRGDGGRVVDGEASNGASNTVADVADAPDAMAPTTIAAATAASTTTTTTTAAAAVAPAPPSADAPARVLVVGDSDAGAFGPYLSELLDATGVVETTVDYKVSSGLARPDFFDWPAHLAAQLPVLDPDIVVVTFGGNDAQGMAERDGSFPTAWSDPVAAEEWAPEYRRRVGEVLDLLADRTVVWVGIPNDDNPDVSERLEVQDQAVRAALVGRDGVVFVDTWARFSSGNGGWAEYVVDPRDGIGKDVRAEDGFHLNADGAEILALDIAELVEAELRQRGAPI